MSLMCGCRSQFVIRRRRVMVRAALAGSLDGPTVPAVARGILALAPPPAHWVRGTVAAPRFQRPARRSPDHPRSATTARLSAAAGELVSGSSASVPPATHRKMHDASNG